MNVLCETKPLKIIIMKTKKQQLIDNKTEYTNGVDLLQCFFSEHINRYCLIFNAIPHIYKTWNGYVAKREYFIKKYNLKQKTEKL